MTPYLIPNKKQESERYREVRDAFVRAVIDEGKVGTEGAVRMMR